VAEPGRLLLGTDAPGRPDQVTMPLELTEQDPARTEITLSQTCDTAEERDMTERGGGMLLDGPAGYLAEGMRG
jgi:hypothetical protein